MCVSGCNAMPNIYIWSSALLAQTTLANITFAPLAPQSSSLRPRRASDKHRACHVSCDACCTIGLNLPFKRSSFHVPVAAIAPNHPT